MLKGLFISEDKFLLDRIRAGFRIRKAMSICLRHQARKPLKCQNAAILLFVH